MGCERASTPLVLAATLGLSLMAGCATLPGALTGAGAAKPATKAPSAPAAAKQPGVAGAGAPSAASVAALGAAIKSSITDPAKQAASSSLGADLGTQLRAERSMRDAELIAGNGLIGMDSATLIGMDSATLIGQDAASYALLWDSRSMSQTPQPAETREPAQTPRPAETREPAQTPEPSHSPEFLRSPFGTPRPTYTGSPRPFGSPFGSPRPLPSGSFGPREEEGREDGDHRGDWEHGDSERWEHDDHDQQERRGESTKEAWRGLTEAARKQAVETHAGRENKLAAKLKDTLSRKRKAFSRQGDAQVQTVVDGSKVATTTFTVTGASGTRTVTVTRKFDAAGTLVQTIQTLAGALDGAQVEASRTREFKPDGSVAITYEARLAAGDQVRTVHWEKAIAPDGALTATGTLTRPDGSQVALSGKGREDGEETIVGGDGDVSVSLAVDAASGTAQATVEAGAAGKVLFTLDADDEDDD